MSKTKKIKRDLANLRAHRHLDCQVLADVLDAARARAENIALSEIEGARYKSVLTMDRDLRKKGDKIYDAIAKPYLSALKKVDKHLSGIFELHAKKLNLPTFLRPSNGRKFVVLSESRPMTYGQKLGSDSVIRESGVDIDAIKVLCDDYFELEKTIYSIRDAGQDAAKIAEKLCSRHMGKPLSGLLKRWPEAIELLPDHCFGGEKPANQFKAINQAIGAAT